MFTKCVQYFLRIESCSLAACRVPTCPPFLFLFFRSGNARPRRFKVALVNKINVLVLEIKSISSCIRTGRASFTSIYTVSIKTGVWNADCGRRTADCGLRTADCRLWTADYGLGVKRILRYKTRTKQYGLNIKRGLRTKFSLPTSVDDFYSPVVTNIR